MVLDCIVTTESHHYCHHHYHHLFWVLKMNIYVIVKDTKLQTDLVYYLFCAQTQHYLQNQDNVSCILAKSVN